MDIIIFDDHIYQPLSYDYELPFDYLIPLVGKAVIIRLWLCIIAFKTLCWLGFKG
jgi:hypothetical protein